MSTAKRGRPKRKVGEPIKRQARPPKEPIEDLNDRVARIAKEQSMPPVGAMPEGQNTKVSSYERENRLKLLHRMLMRQVPLDKIAKEFNVSVGTVQNDRKELYKRLRAQAADINLNELIGSTMGFYNEIQAMALRTASSTGVPMSTRISALKAALSAKNDNHRFLQAAGVFDVLRFQSGEDSQGGSDIEKLVNLTERMMSDDDETESLAVDLGVEDIEEEDESLDLDIEQRLF